MAAGDTRSQARNRELALARLAEALAASAPDVAAAGWAAFYRGLIDDNLTGDRDGAPRWLAQALDAHLHGVAWLEAV